MLSRDIHPQYPLGLYLLNVFHSVCLVGCVVIKIIFSRVHLQLFLNVDDIEELFLLLRTRPVYHKIHFMRYSGEYKCGILHDIMTDIKRESIPEVSGTTTFEAPVAEQAPEATENTEAAVPSESESSPAETTAAAEQQPTRRPAGPRPTVAQVAVPRDELTKQVERIMEEDLVEAFQQLSPIAQQEFKMKGEQTARKIRDLMKGASLKVKKIFSLILEWLKMLPGINRFFLEQEAKIKTDRIIALHKEDHVK